MEVIDRIILLLGMLSLTYCAMAFGRMMARKPMWTKGILVETLVATILVLLAFRLLGIPF